MVIELDGDVRQDVLDDDAPQPQPLGPGGQDIVLSQLLEGKAARHADDVGHRGVGQDDRRHDEMAERVPEHLALAGEQAVDQQKTGTSGHNALGRRRRSAPALGSIAVGRRR